MNEALKDISSNCSTADLRQEAQGILEGIKKVQGENSEQYKQALTQYEAIQRNTQVEAIQCTKEAIDALRSLKRSVSNSGEGNSKEALKEKSIDLMTKQEAIESLKITNSEYKSYVDNSSYTGSEWEKQAWKGLSYLKSKQETISNIKTQYEANLFQEKLIKKILGVDNLTEGYNNEFIHGFNSLRGNYITPISNFQDLLKDDSTSIYSGNKERMINSLGMVNYIRYLWKTNGAEKFRENFIKTFGFKKSKELISLWSTEKVEFESSNPIEKAAMQKLAKDNTGKQILSSISSINSDNLVDTTQGNTIFNLTFAKNGVFEAVKNSFQGLSVIKTEQSFEKWKEVYQRNQKELTEGGIGNNVEEIGKEAGNKFFNKIGAEENIKNIKDSVNKSLEKLLPALPKEQQEIVKKEFNEMGGDLESFVQNLSKEGIEVLRKDGIAKFSIYQFVEQKINERLKSKGIQIDIKDPNELFDISGIVEQIIQARGKKIKAEQEENLKTITDTEEKIKILESITQRTPEQETELVNLKQKTEELRQRKQKLEEKEVTQAGQEKIHQELKKGGNIPKLIKDPSEYLNAVQYSSKLQQIIQESDKKIADINQSYGITKPVDTLKEMGIKTDNFGNIARVQEQNIYKDQQINTTDDGKIYFSVGENKKVEITNQEATLIQNNETAKENLLHFYSILQDCGLEQIWSQREIIFKAISNQKGMAFDTRDGDYLSKNEVKIFLQTVIKSIAPQFKNQGEIEAILSAENEQDIIYFIKNYNGENNLLGPAKDKFGRTKLVEIFNDTFFPQEKQRVFQFAQFESAIRS